MRALFHINLIWWIQNCNIFLKKSFCIWQTGRSNLVYLVFIIHVTIMDYSCLLQCGVNCNSVETTSTDPANIRLDEDVLIKANMFALALRLQKTSWRRLQDILVKANIFVLAIRLQGIFKTSCQDVFKMFWRRLQNVFKTSSRRLQTSCKDIFKIVFKTYHQVKLFLLTRL